MPLHTAVWEGKVEAVATGVRGRGAGKRSRQQQVLGRRKAGRAKKRGDYVLHELNTLGQCHPECSVVKPLSGPVNRMWARPLIPAWHNIVSGATFGGLSASFRMPSPPEYEALAQASGAVSNKSWGDEGPAVLKSVAITCCAS